MTEPLSRDERWTVSDGCDCILCSYERDLQRAETALREIADQPNPLRHIARAYFKEAGK